MNSSVQTPKEKMRVAVVDDEPPARNRIKQLLAKLSDRAELVAECSTGHQAISCIHNQSIDLMFLDIQMPEMTGLEVLECAELRRLPEVIFVTAFDQWAIRAFEVNAVDYLLKPFENSRFNEAFDRAALRIRSLRQTELPSTTQMAPIANLLSDFRAIQPPKRILVKSQNGLIFVDFEEVVYIKASDKFIKLNCSSRSYLVRKSMKQILEIVKGLEFVRIHRSYIVNLLAVERIEPYFHGDYRAILKDGTELPVSRNYKSNLVGDVT